MRQQGAGRPCAAEEARTKFFTVRLTPAEKAAIKNLEQILTDLIRQAAADQIRAQQGNDLPKAS